MFSDQRNFPEINMQNLICKKKYKVHTKNKSMTQITVISVAAVSCTGRIIIDPFPSSSVCVSTESTYIHKHDISWYNRSVKWRLALLFPVCAGSWSRRAPCAGGQRGRVTCPSTVPGPRRTALPTSICWTVPPVSTAWPTATTACASPTSSSACSSGVMVQYLKSITTQYA